MSYAVLKIIKNNKVKSYQEYKNSHGGASFIWDCVFDKYLKDPSIPYDNWLMNSEKLWPLWKDKKLPEYQRLVLASTYDNVVIEFDKLSQLAEYFRKFVEEFGRNGKVCHLLDWADQLKKISESETSESCQGICFYLTSVSEDPWLYDKEIIDEDGEVDYESMPYDLTKGDKHWFLFAEYEKQAKAEPG